MDASGSTATPPTATLRGQRRHGEHGEGSAAASRRASRCVQLDGHATNGARQGQRRHVEAGVCCVAVPIAASLHRKWQGRVSFGFCRLVPRLAARTSRSQPPTSILHVFQVPVITRTGPEAWEGVCLARSLRWEPAANLRATAGANRCRWDRNATASRCVRLDGHGIDGDHGEGSAATSRRASRCVQLHGLDIDGNTARAAPPRRGASTRGRSPRGARRHVVAVRPGGRAPRRGGAHLAVLAVEAVELTSHLDAAALTSRCLPSMPWPSRWTRLDAAAVPSRCLWSRWTRASTRRRWPRGARGQRRGVSAASSLSLYARRRNAWGALTERRTDDVVLDLPRPGPAGFLLLRREIPD